MISAASALVLLALSGAPTAGRVTAAEVNLHVAPSAGSPIIGFAHRGAELPIAGCTPSCEEGQVRWYLLAPRGAVRAALLSAGGGGDLAPEPDDYLYGVVLGPAPIREAPSKDAKVVGELGPHRSVAFLDDSQAPQGWLHYRLGGFVAAAAVKIDRPSTFGGEVDPAFPVAFLPDSVRLGTKQDRITIAKQARFGAAEVGPRQVVAGGFTLPREAVRVAWGRARPRNVKKDARWIHVDLEEQVLTAYEGDRPVLATLISSGKRGHETIPGHWAVWLKTRHDRMHGRDYDLEEVPWSMYFHDDQALHGAFWHDRFGHRLTHGCVNLSVADAAWLFDWTSPDVPDGWHTATWTAGLPVTTVLVEERIRPEDRLRPIRSPELRAAAGGDPGDFLRGLADGAGAHSPGGNGRPAPLQ